jgi:aminopeptidase N
MSLRLIMRLLIISLSIIAGMPLLASDLDSDGVRFDTMTVSEGHRAMAAMKAQHLANYRAAQKKIPSEALASSQTDYDVNHYRIEITVDITNQMIYGNVTMTAKSLVDGLNIIEVDLDATMIVDSVYMPGITLSYTHSLGRLAIDLDKSYDQNSILAVSVCYHGNPVQSGLDGFSFKTRNGVPIVASLSEPYMARTWWPCKDRPDDKADSLDIFITCDAAYFCASNGTLVDTIVTAGQKTFYYTVRYPIATYLFSIAISDYTVYKDYYYPAGSETGMEIVNHVYPDRYSSFLPVFNHTAEAIGVFANLFGEYPFLNEKYGHANFQWGGAMEHQTCTSISGNGNIVWLMVHELSHQWWGDMISPTSWHDIWLNEGFASYCEALYFEATAGKAAYHSWMANMDYSDTGCVYVSDTTDPWKIFDGTVYDKGAWIVHMLRHVVGDSTFFDIMKTYYDSPHKYSSASIDDFKAICEQVSGQDLDYFFEEWMLSYYRPAYLTYFMNEPDSSDGKNWTYLVIQQSSAYYPPVYKMPIDLLFSFGGQDTTTKTIFNDIGKQVLIFKTDKPATAITLDPEKWIYRNAAKGLWQYTMIPTPLDTGTQYASFRDTIIVRGGSEMHKFSIISGLLPPGLKLDTLTGVISGGPWDSGDFTFMVRAKDQYSTYKDSAEFHITVLPGSGLPGDADISGAVNLLDVSFIISYLYRGGPPPGVPVFADVNKDCKINLLDVSYIINYLYRDGPDPEMGCAL